MGDDIPDFDLTNSDDDFQVKDPVYVIDENGFDIWDAIILTVDDDSISVHYPEYEEDATGIPRYRILRTTPRNKRTSQEQEKVRADKKRPKEEEEEDEIGPF